MYEDTNYYPCNTLTFFKLTISKCSVDLSSKYQLMLPKTILELMVYLKDSKGAVCDVIHSYDSWQQKEMVHRAQLPMVFSSNLLCKPVNLIRELVPRAFIEGWLHRYLMPGTTSFQAPELKEIFSINWCLHSLDAGSRSFQLVG